MSQLNTGIVRPGAVPSSKIDTTFVVPPDLQAKGSGKVDTTFVVPKDLQAGQPRDGFDNTISNGPLKPLGNKPELTQHGGAVLDKPTIGNIYIGDYWKTGQGAADAKENDAFAVDFGNSKMMDVAAQYGAGKTNFLGSTVVGGPSPARFTESDIQSAVKTALANGSIQKDAQGMYTVVLPPGSVLDAGDVDSTQGLGGFHGSIDDGTGKPIYYAAIAYSDTKGNGIDFDGNSQHAVNITESHEWMEAMTDPDVNSTIPGRGLAWYDDTDNGEIGDLMMPIQLNAGLPISKSFDQDAGGFMQQLEWSNKDGLFEIAAGSGPQPGGDVTGSSTPNKALKTGKSTSDTITLGDDAKIQDLKVSVDLTHKKSAGITATLTSPSGTTVTIPLKAGKHETGTFDLSAFNGESTKGAWKLTVKDTASKDSGTLKSWSLDASVAPAA